MSEELTRMANIDRIAAEKAELKDKQLAERQALHAEYVEAVEDDHLQRAIAAVTEAAAREGKTPEEMANYWLANDYADPGRHINARRYLEGRIVNAKDVGQTV